MRKPIVIVGGMGPQASLRFHELLIEKSKSHHSGRGDEFPFIVHFSVPIEDFIRDRSKEQSAAKSLNTLDVVLRQLQPGTITLACNTAHILKPRVGFMQLAEFVSMLESVAAKVKGEGIRSVGLLASPTTIRTKLYEEVLLRHGVDILLPSNSQLPDIELVIRNVISGRESKDSPRLTKIAHSLQQRGAEATLLGCTELPLAFDKSSSKIPVFDCSDIYAEAVIGRHYLYNGG